MNQVVSVWSKGAMHRLLKDGSEWNRRIERMTDKLAPKFKRVSREDIKKMWHVWANRSARSEVWQFRQLF